MKLIDEVTSAGRDRPNEDRLGQAGRLAWVIDGATDLEPDAFLPASSDVQWLVDRVGVCLTEAGGCATGDPEQSERVLESLAERIGREMEDMGFPEDRIHPTCSIGLLAESEQQLRMLRVGDPSCLAFGADIVELSTDFFGRREAQAVRQAGGGGLEDAEARRGIVRRRQEYIEGSLPESVFSGHPQARLRTYSAVANPGRTSHVLLCTDGFARAVVDYALYPDWESLLNDARERGLAEVVRRIRAHETGSVTGASPDETRHFKKADDATALLVEIQRFSWS